MSPFRMVTAFWTTAIRPFVQWLMNNYIPHTNISYFVLICVPLVFDFVIMVIKYVVHGQAPSEEIHNDAHPPAPPSRQLPPHRYRKGR